MAEIETNLHKPRYEPTLHKPVPMGVRVVIPEYFVGKKMKGEVAGISSMHVIFHYIVLLDEPIESEFGLQKAITVGGPQLEAEDGSNWRLER